MLAEILYSVHDVAPETMSRVAGIIARLEQRGVRPLVLLVVPGGEWSESQVASLRVWQDSGHALAAHGWTHRSMPPRGLYHRLHSAILSRDAAEHLGLTRDAALELIRRSHAWFGSVGLRLPAIYVPPAWALGAVHLADFESTPFRWVECLAGLYEVRARRLHRLPLAGFEADTAARAVGLRAWNAVNTLCSAALGRPMRAAIHPRDFELRLGRDLERRIESSRRQPDLAAQLACS
jgi:hypothetical protein